MAQRAVHRVYAEEEPAGPDYDGYAGDGTAEANHRVPEEGSAQLRGRPGLRPAWRAPRQSRAVAMALLCGVVAFFAALAVHALSGSGAVGGGAGAGDGGRAGFQSVAARVPHRVKAQAHRRVPQRAHRQRAARRTWRARVRPARRVQLTASAPRAEERAVSHYSTDVRARVPAARAAEYEFSFEP